MSSVLRQGGHASRPIAVMASPRPTRYGPRTQAFSPCRGSDPGIRYSGLRHRAPAPEEHGVAAARCRASRDPHRLARPLTARLRPWLRPRHSRPRGRKSGWVAIGSQASRSVRHSGTTGPESEENGLRADHALVPQRAWTVAMRGVGSYLPGPPV